MLVWFIVNYFKIFYQYDIFYIQYWEIYWLSMEIMVGDYMDYYVIMGKFVGEFLFKNYIGIEGYVKLKFYFFILFIDGKVFEEKGVF